MKKKLLMILMALTLSVSCVTGLAACAAPAGNEILIMVPNADHGWTGAVLKYAQEKASEISKAGTYTATVKTADSSASQVQQLEDLMVSSNKPKGIVILPYDNEVQNAMIKLANSNIPFIMFDRIIDTAAVQNKVIANVKGDNEGIGAATAKRFVDKGMLPGDLVYEMIGDTSSVPTARSNGFREYLTGDRAVGGAKIATDKKWTTAQLSSISKTDATGWSRETGKAIFTTWIATKTQADMPKWIFTHDDEIGMGVLEALQSGAIDEAKKTMFNSVVKSLGSSSGLNEMYSVLKDNHKSVARPTTFDLFSVTYDPAMIKTAIDEMVNSLSGKEVKKDYVIGVSVVDKDNVASFQGFGDAVAKA